MLETDISPPELREFQKIMKLNAVDRLYKIEQGLGHPSMLKFPMVFKKATFFAQNKTKFSNNLGTFFFANMRLVKIKLFIRTKLLSLKR